MVRLYNIGLGCQLKVCGTALNKSYTLTTVLYLNYLLQQKIRHFVTNCDFF